MSVAPADAAVRARALDPSTSFIVQAPAGAGKTELLTRRFLRLLATVEQPEEILAITFTRKAAAEMRQRIVDALLLGADPDPPAQPHRIETWHLARAAREADERHGWHLDSHPARLKVQTIDALNHALARQLPILSGTGASLRIARDAATLHAEAVRRVLEHVAGDTPVAFAIERVLRHLDNRVDTLTVLLTDLLARRDHWLDLDLLHADRSSLRERLESALQHAVLGRLQQLHDRWPPMFRDELLRLARGAQERLLATAPDHPLASVPLGRFPGVRLEDLPAWRGLRQLLLTGAGEWRRTVTVNDGFPPAGKADKQAMIGLLEGLAAGDEGEEGTLAAALREVTELPGTRYPQGQWVLIDALLDVLRIALAELALVFREHGEVDHVTAALAARQALGSPEAPTDLALRLDYRLRHLLVDEFQDTSRSQIRLLQMLTAGWTRGDGRTVFLVGDPMQSIYRFREADVGLFLKLQQQGLGDVALESLTLSVNFRSSRPVIDWINGTFPRVLPRRDDPERGGVRFTPSAPRPEAPGAGGVQMHALVGAPEQTRAEEAERVADLVAAARQRDPQGTIAILVPSRAHLDAILPLLASRGLRYRAVDIDRLRERPVVQDLLSLTRALLHLADRPAWLAVLRAPWCGLTLADLHVLAGNDPDPRRPATIWSRLADDDVLRALSPDGRLRAARLRDVLQLALAERGRHALRDWIERAWLKLGGPATTGSAADLDDADAYFARLDELDDAGDLDDVVQLEDDIADLYANPATAEADADGPPVEIMTLHKAKGLEFDTVILPGLERRGARDSERLLQWLDLPRADTGPALLLGPLPARDADEDPLYLWLRNIEKERARLEKGRLLYVGATRAVRELHLIAAAQPVEQKGEIRLRQPDSESPLRRLWPMVRYRFEAELDRAVTVVAPAASRGGIALRRLPSAWRPSLDGLEGLDVPTGPDVTEQGLHPEFDWVGETGRHVGTLVHREIERAVRGGPDGPGVPAAADRARLAAELAELGVPESHRAEAVERVAQALANLATDERARWLLAGPDVHREAASELALSGIVGRTLVSGVIDRTFVAADGTRWIVDFKTSQHAGAGLAEFLASEAERYRPQLARYAALMRGWRPAEPVRAALYFPLLKAWVEVEIGATP